MSVDDRGRDGLHPPLLRRMKAANLQRIDLAIAFVLLVATLPYHAFGVSGRNNAHAALLVLAFGAALPIAIRRRWPMVALAIATVAISIATAIGQSFAPDPLIAIPVYQVASVRERNESVPALGLVALALIIATAIGSASYPGQSSFSVLLAIAAWFVGDSARVRRAYNAGLAEQAEQRAREELERAQRGVAEERLRIARELHDVVAHSLSVIAVQSGVGRHVIDDQPEQAKTALAAVETTSRAALEELRRMLGVLRRPDSGGPDLSPAPGIVDIAPLLDQIRGAGFPVGLTSDGVELDLLSPSLQLSVYRIVQEALTNVVKHAGPANVTVVLRRDRGDFVVEVTDDGLGSTSAYPTGERPDHHGILGMRERAALFNGSLAAGPLPDGGFRVTARLPLEGVALS